MLLNDDINAVAVADLAPVDSIYPDALTASIEKLKEHLPRLVAIKESIQSALSMDSIAKTVLAMESISSSDAQDIQQAYPGLTDDVAQPGEFTEVPTRTNLDKVQRYVKSALDAAKDTLKITQHEYINETKDSAAGILAALSTVFVPRLLGDLEMLKTEALNEMADKASVGGYLFYTNDDKPRLLDLKRTAIRYMSSYGEVIDENIVAEGKRLGDIVAQPFVQKALELSKFASYAADNGNLLHKTWHYQHPEEKELLCTYIDLMMLLGSGRLIEFIDASLQSLQKEGQVVQAELDVFEHSSLVLLGDSSKMAESLSDYHEKLLSMSLLTWSLLMMANSAKNLMTLFQAFKATATK